MCLLRLLLATDQALRTQICFLHLSSVRNDLEHSTYALRVHRIREPHPHPMNVTVLDFQMQASSFHVASFSVPLSVAEGKPEKRKKHRAG